MLLNTATRKLDSNRWASMSSCWCLNPADLVEVWVFEAQSGRAFFSGIKRIVFPIFSISVFMIYQLVFWNSPRLWDFDGFTSHWPWLLGAILHQVRKAWHVDWSKLELYLLELFAGGCKYANTCFILYYIILYYIICYRCIVLLYCSVLYYIILYHIVLYYTISYHIMSHHIIPYIYFILYYFLFC